MCYECILTTQVVHINNGIMNMLKQMGGKTMKRCLIILISILMATACSTPDNTIDLDDDISVDVEAAQLSDAILELKPSLSPRMVIAQRAFNLNLLQEMSKSSGNLFYSSLSINSALTGMYLGSAGNTTDEMNRVLCYNAMDYMEIASSQKAIIASYEEDGDTIFNIANALWINEGNSVKQSFANNMTNIFKMRIETLDLSSNKAVNRINDWADESTNGMIEQLVDIENNHLADNSLVLMNAIYFEGTWAKPFKEANTTESDFFGSLGTTEVQMMHNTLGVTGYENDYYKAIQLPYGGNRRFILILVLPKDDIDNFIQEQNLDSIKGIFNDFKYQSNAEIAIPKFEMNEKLDLRKTLSNMGMTISFTNSADFSGVSQDPLFIDGIIHTAVLKVDEVGTKAAAITEVTTAEASPPSEPFVFTADRPFLFFIVDTHKDLVLFTGKISDLE